MLISRAPFKKMRPELVLRLVVRQSAHELSLKASRVKRPSVDHSGILGLLFHFGSGRHSSRNHSRSFLALLFSEGFHCQASHQDRKSGVSVLPLPLCLVSRCMMTESLLQIGDPVCPSQCTIPTQDQIEIMQPARCPMSLIQSITKSAL